VRPNTIVVFTVKSVSTILAHRGSAAWRLNRNHARLCKYLICTRNAYGDDVEGSEPHKSAFLIGKVSGVVPAPEEKERWLIEISEFAQINVTDAWKGWRNPVHYASLDEFGLDPALISFEPVPTAPGQPDAPPVESWHQPWSLPIQPNAALPVAVQSSAGVVEPVIPRLTIEEAKRALAVTFGVKPEAIEITIRG
jgi:hypothetical protein